MWQDLGLEVLSKFGSVKTVDANFDKRSVCFEDITFAVSQQSVVRA